jgi:hypothetical protein
MLLILPAGLGLALTLLVVSSLSGRPAIRNLRPWALSALAGYGIAYCLALIMVSLQPIWVTDGVEVWAEFPEHFLWALLATAGTQFIGVPAALLGFALYRRPRRRD